MQRTIQEPQGSLARLAAVEAEVLQDVGLARNTGALLATGDSRQKATLGAQTHVRGFGNHDDESTFR